MKKFFFAFAFVIVLVAIGIETPTVHAETVENADGGVTTQELPSVH
ncbi:MAG TPA: hypothetical protein VK190_06960 [Pseudoneobacillus sp.]|nr:hypothetical protein [Pseudoneobacillus sp.]